MAGRFTLMLVVGDAGIGKTTLADVLVDRVGIPVGSNRCSDLEAELPYVALSLALRPVLDQGGDGPMPVVSELLRRADLAEPFDHFARMRVMESLATRGRGAQPVPAGARRRALGRRRDHGRAGLPGPTLRAGPGAVLLTSDRGRVTERCAGSRWTCGSTWTSCPGRTSPRSGTRSTRRPTVTRCSSTDWLAAAEQGLPDGFTPALRERVITRCWDFGPQAYRLLTVAAVLDQPFSPVLLSQLVGAAEDVVDELDRLVDARLLTDEGPGFRFRHGLVQRILRETFSAARRARLLARAETLGQGTPRRRATDLLDLARAEGSPAPEGERRRSAAANGERRRTVGAAPAADDTGD